MKKGLIISIVLNIIFLIIIGYFLFSPGIAAIKKELNEKNSKLEEKKVKLLNENEILRKENRRLVNESESKNTEIKEGKEKLNEKLITISKLKKQIKKIESFKNSSEFKSLIECQGEHTKLRLNCLKLEEENKEWVLALNYCKQNTIKLEENIEIKNSMIINKNKIIFNKDEEIGIEIEKRINVEKAMGKTIISMKKKKFISTLIKITVAAIIGYATAKFKLL